MTQHIIDTDELEVTDDIREDAIAANVITKDMNLFRQQWNCIIRYGQLRVKRALQANSPQADGMVLVQAAQAIDALASSGENKDDWTITRDLAFHRASEAVRALIVNPQADDVRKDAQRFKFVIDNCHVIYWKGGLEYPVEYNSQAIGHDSALLISEIDQAIDKARE